MAPRGVVAAEGRAVEGVFVAAKGPLEVAGEFAGRFVAEFAGEVATLFARGFAEVCGPAFATIPAAWAAGETRRGGARAMLGVEQPASEASPKEASVAASQRWRWGCSNRLQVGMGITGKERDADAGQLRGLNGCSKTTQVRRGCAPEMADSEGFIGSTDHSGFANWGNCGFDDWGALPLPQQRRYNCVGKLASIVDSILYIRILCPDCGGQT
jgi:hypothetical protein